MVLGKDGPPETRSNEQLIVDKVYIIEQTINAIEKMCIINLILLIFVTVKIFLP